MVLRFRTIRPRAAKQSRGDCDLEVVVGDNCVPVLLQVELFRFVELLIAHDKKYSMMAAEDKPDMPLKMWLVRAGTLSKA